MRKAKVISETLLSLVKEAQGERQRMSVRQSEIDKEISAITHELELVRLNAIQAYKVTVRLQELLRERREIKHEIEALRSLCDTMRSYNLETQISKVASNVKAKLAIQDDLIEDRGVIKSILGAKKLATV
jgi:uncharacterized protein (DUF111 family)